MVHSLSCWTYDHPATNPPGVMVSGRAAQTCDQEEEVRGMITR
jgi:hypothetical protein